MPAKASLPPSHAPVFFRNSVNANGDPTHASAAGQASVRLLVILGQGERTDLRAKLGCRSDSVLHMQPTLTRFGLIARLAWKTSLAPRCLQVLDRLARGVTSLFASQR